MDSGCMSGLTLLGARPERRQPTVELGLKLGLLPEFNRRITCRDLRRAYAADTQMCGMFGYVGARDDAPQVVLAGLKKLEYRGYDSWGIAVRHNGSTPARLLVEKHTGKIGQAATSLPAGRTALGHTRWATHGGVTRTNAHPHLDCGGRLAVIHNGIVENYAELKRDLISDGQHTFQSQTDTEVVCHLLEDELRDAPALPLIQATLRVFRRLDGLNAISVLDRQAQCIVVAKNGSPVVIGHASDGTFVASDSTALLEHTRRLTFLEDGQAALISGDGVALYDIASGEQITSARIYDVAWLDEPADLDGFPHFMVKEMREQPGVLRRLARERLSDATTLARSITRAEQLYLVGCGSAAHAARWGEHVFACLARRRARAFVGSEFGSIVDFLDTNSLVVGLSQSGETIDLLECMTAARARGARLAGLVNVEGSSIYRLVDQPVLLSAGPERCVLATKSFTAKLALLLLAAYAARAGVCPADAQAQGRAVLERAADEIEQFFVDGRAEQARALAHRLADREHLYVIGRGPSYPLALEAALKIKEVSYIHAEGLAGGEMKHGAIALIEPGTPCLVLAPNDETLRATLSGAQEIKARGGYIVGVSPISNEVWDEHIQVADLGEATAIVNAIPPQVLAYELAVRRGLDPDKPRNLAKSVTVK
jgi:glutamine---fructose-6-phosphate transaminase (isomerizing)